MATVLLPLTFLPDTPKAFVVGRQLLYKGKPATSHCCVLCLSVMFRVSTNISLCAGLNRYILLLIMVWVSFIAHQHSVGPKIHWKVYIGWRIKVIWNTLALILYCLSHSVALYNLQYDHSICEVWKAKIAHSIYFIFEYQEPHWDTDVSDII